MLTASSAAQYVRHWAASLKTSFNAVLISNVKETSDGAFDVTFAFRDQPTEWNIFTVWLEQAADGSSYLYGEW